MRRHILFLLLIGAGAWFCQAARAEDEIVIGEYGLLTGGTATFGTSTDEGVRLALDEINSSGECWESKFAWWWRTINPSRRRR